MNTANIYAYGFSTGIFFAMFLCFVMFLFLHQVRQYKSQYASAIFFYGAVSVLCFGLLDLYVMSYEMNQLKHTIPSWVLSMGRYGAPLGLFLNFHIFMQALPINTVDTFVIWNSYKRLYPLVIAYFITSFFILFMIQDPLWSMIMPMILIVMNHVILFPLSYNTLKTIPTSKNYLQVLSVMIMAFIIVIILFISGAFNQIPQQVKPLMHILMACIFLAYNFVLCRFLLEGSFPNEEISGVNATALYKDIYAAINNHEFYLEYQPKVDLTTQRVHGLEALIRWNHPKEGFISPAEFIYTAEKTQLIDNICRWVIQQTVKDLIVFRERGIYAPVSINFSVNNLNPKMVMFLQQSLKNNNLPMNAVIVEITESVFLDINSDIQKSIVLLDQIGIKVSLDDFGAGYSSLRHLTDMGFREVKIDRALISKIFDPKQKIIIETIINMCHSLNISIVAEGINEKLIIQRLLELSCSIGQGYFICRPKRLEDVISWIENHHIKKLEFK